MQRIIEQALRRIPSEPYPELRLVLETFVGGVRDAVRANFVGAYLVGSLATGDFDHDSDIDFVVVTSGLFTIGIAGSTVPKQDKNQRELHKGTGALPEQLVHSPL